MHTTIHTLRFPHRTTCVLNLVLPGRRTVYVCSDCMSKFSPVGVPPSGVVVALVVLSFYNLQFTMNSPILINSGVRPAYLMSYVLHVMYLLLYLEIESSRECNYITTVDA